MSSHEYRVIPAPRRSARAKGARKPEERFARSVEAVMNRMAREGWEFVRSDTLPHERKAGWFGRRETVFETLLVFRRPEGAERAAPAMPPPVALQPPSFLAAPSAEAPQAPVPAPAATRYAPPLAQPPASPVAPPRPANVPPAAPTLTLVEPPRDDDPRRAAE
jgi:hypothetical protein